MGIDYEYKRVILTEYAELLKQQRKASMLSYSNYLAHCEGVLTYSFRHSNGVMDNQELETYCKANNLVKQLKECKRINEAFYKRNDRLKSRITNIIAEGGAVFVTLTFRDDVIANTSEKTRRRYVSRFLKENCSRYVANIDFGVDERYTQREHYHAVVNERINGVWQYGFAFYERIINSNVKSLSKYITKLTNHAIKENARRSALIYSR